MNPQLALNIIQQFDNELSALINNECALLSDFESKKEQQRKLERIIAQRRESLDYLKKELAK